MRIANASVLIALFLLGSPLAHSQTRQPPPRSQYSPLAAQQEKNPQAQRRTWYEVALNRINPDNVDYGTWMEQRRQAFVQATIQNRYFNYALAMTLVSLFLLGTYAKLWNDSKRKEWVTAEMMTDLLNHDQHSRVVAKEAICKYNDHMECCNRVIEAAESGRPVPGSATEAEDLRAQLRESETNLATLRREKETIEGELKEKKILVAQLSLRVEGVTKGPNGDGILPATDRGHASSSNEESETARLMHHINNLQQQLYAERKKNERLRGA